MIPKLDIGWWAAIAMMLFMEIAAICTLDYILDPIPVIVCIHLFPLIGIFSIFKWGPSK